MTNYFGKTRLTKLLYFYLESTSPAKLAELKRELGEEGERREYKLYYKKSHGSEWLKTEIFVGEVAFYFEIYSCGGSGKCVNLRERRSIDDNGTDAPVEKETFNGYAYYDANFCPINPRNERVSYELFCEDLAKTTAGKTRKE